MSILTAKQEIINKFREIKGVWIETGWNDDNRLGNEFEEQLGVLENNLKIADYKGIELKTQRNKSSAMITLFSQAPYDPQYSNTKLREKFGYPDSHMPEKNRLSASTTFKGCKSKKANRIFKLSLDDINQKLSLTISKSLIDLSLETFKQEWSYQIFHDAIEKKLKTIAFISGDEKVVKGIAYVRFTKLEFFTDFTFEKLKEAIINNHLKLDIRLGVYKSGNHVGEHHDHGSGFRITYRNLLKYVSLETYE